MSINNNIRKQHKMFIISFMINTLVSVTLAVFFSYIFLDGNKRNIGVAVTAAVVMPLFFFIVERYIFGRSFFKRLSFGASLFSRVFIVVISFIIIISLIVMIFFPEMSLLLIYSQPHFYYGVVFGFLMFLMFYFVDELKKIIGKQTFLVFLSGIYHKPRTVNRVFMFLDLVDSTSIAEDLTHEDFHQYVNDFIIDVTEVLDSNGAEIYKYVGDEVIAVWDMGKKFKKDMIVKSLLEIEDRFVKREEYYHKKYGLIPDFKGGLHCGEVIAGEMGDVKKELVYLGDVVNTTARLVGVAGETGNRYVFSGQLKDRLGLSVDEVLILLGEKILKGKKDKFVVYALKLEN